MILNLLIQEKYEDMAIDFQKSHQPKIIIFFL